jgi:hypothetical protein
MDKLWIALDFHFYETGLIGNVRIPFPRLWVTPADHEWIRPSIHHIES